LQICVSLKPEKGPVTVKVRLLSRRNAIIGKSAVETSTGACGPSEVEHGAVELSDASPSHRRGKVNPATFAPEKPLSPLALALPTGGRSNPMPVILASNGRRIGNRESESVRLRVKGTVHRCCSQ
jgi:hypothetical protein